MYSSLGQITTKDEYGKGLYDKITETNDYQIEYDFIYDSNRLDNLEISDTLVYNYFAPSINTDILHFIRYGNSNHDSYLSTVGLRVSPEFDNVYKIVKGIHLDAVNVFAPVFNVGTFEKDGDVFTSISDIGTGKGKRSSADWSGCSNNYAASQLRFYPSGNPIGGSDFIFQIHALKDDLTLEIETITIPAGTLTTEYVDSENKYFNIVSGITSLDGTDGDTVLITTVLEREIKL